MVLTAQRAFERVERFQPVIFGDIPCTPLVCLHEVLRFSE